MSCYNCIKCRVSDIGITCSFYPTPVVIINPNDECVYTREIEIEIKLKEI